MNVKYYRPFHGSYFPGIDDTQWINYNNVSYRCIFYIWMIMSTVFLNTLYTCRIGMIPYMDMVRLIKFIWLMSNEDNYVNKKLINLINNLFSAKKVKYALVGWPLSSLFPTGSLKAVRLVLSNYFLLSNENYMISFLWKL